MSEFDKKTLNQLRGKLLRNEPLSRYTSWRVGGKADWLYRPADVEDLSCFLKGLPLETPLFFLGAGTNLLVRDGGIRGMVISFKNILKNIEKTNRLCLKAEAGLYVARLAHFAAEQGLKGLEFLAGIPGTLGGALSMNAGAYGSEIWQAVTKVTTIDRTGKLHERKPSDYQIGYRQVVLPTPAEWFIEAELELCAGNPEESKMLIAEMLAKRRASQPLTFPNAGSVFRNPAGQAAWKLIDACSLRGYRIGGASVSEKHSNFIVNDQNASAKDIEQLICYVAETVRQKTGIMLHQEVKVIGDP